MASLLGFWVVPGPYAPATARGRDPARQQQRPGGATKAFYIVRDEFIHCVVERCECRMIACSGMRRALRTDNLAGNLNVNAAPPRDDPALRRSPAGRS